MKQIRIGRTTAAVLAVLALFFIYGAFGEAYASTWSSFGGNDENNAVVSYETPTEQKLTEPAWVKRFGEGVDGMMNWNSAPNIPIIVNGDIITTSGKSILRIDAATGETLAEGALDYSVNWGYTPLTYAELPDGRGVLFCPLAGGLIEAVDAETFKKLWTFDAEDQANGGANKLISSKRNSDGEMVPVPGAKHQSISPIVYSDGMVYTGFYSAYDNTDYYVGIAAAEMTGADQETGKSKVFGAGELVWKYESPGGFYWNGGVVIGDAVITGTQDGVNNNDVTGVSGGASADSYIIALDRKTGEVISNIMLEKASDICSSIAYDKEGTGRIYWTSCSGMIFSAAVDKEAGAISDVRMNRLSGTNTLTVSTPAVYKGRVYIGYTSKEAYGYFAAYDADTLAEIYKAELRGYPKSSPVITTAYEGTTGDLYAYLVYYQEPGGVQVVKFRADSTGDGDVTVSDLFDANGYEQYAAGCVAADDKGQLYYKNDSNTIFAMRKCDEIVLDKVSGVRLKPSGNKVAVSFGKTADATDYRVLYRLNYKGSFSKVMTQTEKASFEVPNSSVVTVKVRAEHTDAAKAVYGAYSDDISTYAAVSSIKKITAGKKAFTLKFDMHSQADGYQIQYSLKKSMKKAKTVKKTGYRKTKYKVAKLKPKKAYFVRVRSYRKIDGKPYYGKWSKVKKIKVK